MIHISFFSVFKALSYESNLYFLCSCPLKCQKNFVEELCELARQSEASLEPENYVDDLEDNTEPDRDLDEDEDNG